MTSVAKPGLSSALWALILREMETRFGRRALGYAWALLEPGVYVVLMLTLMPFYTVLVAMVLILGGLVMERFVRKWTME